MKPPEVYCKDCENYVCISSLSFHLDRCMGHVISTTETYKGIYTEYAKPRKLNKLNHCPFFKKGKANIKYY